MSKEGICGCASVVGLFVVLKVAVGVGVCVCACDTEWRHADVGLCSKQCDSIIFPFDLLKLLKNWLRTSQTNFLGF